MTMDKAMNYGCIEILRRRSWAERLLTWPWHPRCSYARQIIHSSVLNAKVRIILDPHLRPSYICHFGLAKEPVCI